MKVIPTTFARIFLSIPPHSSSSSQKIDEVLPIRAVVTSLDDNLFNKPTQLLSSSQQKNEGYPIRAVADSLCKTFLTNSTHLLPI